MPKVYGKAGVLHASAPHDIVPAEIRMMMTADDTSLPSAQKLTYPTARKDDQVDDYFGVQVADPYRWMEDLDAPELAAWIAEENTLTRSVLDAVPERAAMHDRLMQLINFERYTVPRRKGTRYFYSHNSGLQNQNTLYWTEGLDGTPNVLLDPNTMSADGTVAIAGLSVSDDGMLAAYAIADAGSDWMKWYVRDVTTGKDLPDVIAWSKFSSASWLKDGSGFFYEGYDAPEGDALKSTNYFHKVFFHKLGTPQSEDTLVFHRPDDGELNLGAVVTDDGRYLLLLQAKGSSPKNELSVKDLQQPDAPVIAIASVADALYSPIDNDGTRFWIHTTLDAPNGRVIEVDLNDLARENWKTIIPEGRNHLDGVSMIDNTLIASYLADAQNIVELHSPEGHHIGRLTLPAIGTVAGFGGKRTDTETFYLFTNFTTPSTIYRLEMASRESTPYREPKLQFHPADYETKQIFYTSKDGTRVPMFVSHKRGLKLDGNNPTMLYGYGGFNVSLQPEFSSSNLLWMEMGGVYAQPSLRGGGEYGENWHLAGTKQNKQNVFDDFIAAAEWLIANKYTMSGRLAISGASNGGLLVAACEIQRPDLFGAVLPAVGVLDMLRFDKFTIGWAWKTDYGAPSENEAEFEAIYRYSPLQNVKPGTAYPPTLITTADHDDRVFPAHSFKYAAALQAAQAGANPILIRVETRAGHGGGMPLSKRVDLVVDQYAFLLITLRIAASITVS
ncbi:MAG: prolyl oligopeptidase family serine peptidase [Edaphobacter sp.]|uniref:prolyl oligopeptidase family serine peptidase n=1 Tax=Edaphobacter sp. TaxID=1934404 RepID=UPI0023961F2C|nr:prolyl oligopeptidase family serine peptidase [Edaphobacter sp.]MDE1178041.1 prolyl oligopeptidase family serine peptidase [Edaphobacter sp.]